MKILRYILILGLGLFLLSSLGFATGQPYKTAKRKGFIFGFGIGSGYLFPRLSSDFFDVKLDNKLTLLTNLKIGYAFTDQLMIYYSSKVNWYGDKNGQEEKTIFATGQAGLSASYFLNPGNKSPFISAGAGFSGLSTPLEAGSTSSSGLGFFAGIGYEFTDNFTLEADLIYGNPRDKTSIENLRQKNFSVGITLNLLIH